MRASNLRHRFYLALLGGIFATGSAACSSTNKAVEMGVACRSASRTVAATEPTPLGFTGRELVDKAVSEYVATIQFADGRTSNLRVAIAHQGAEMRYTPPKDVSPPNLDILEVCEELLSTTVKLSMVSDDGSIKINQSALLKGRRTNETTVEQQLVLTGPTGSAPFPDSESLLGTLTVPPSIVQGQEISVASIRITAERTGSIAVVGSRKEGGSRRRSPELPFAMW